MYKTIENDVPLQPLPEISRIPGVILPPATFSDCLMVLQFLHSFGKMLRLDIDVHMLNPRDLQEGLLNMGDNAGRLQDMLVRMLSVAVNDPGMPAGHKVRGWQCVLKVQMALKLATFSRFHVLLLSCSTCLFI